VGCNELSTDLNAAVHDQGVIKYMSVPQGWIEDQIETFDTSELRFFHPSDDSDAKLCFFYRGLPIETEAGQKFVNALSQPPHILTAAEIKSLHYALGESANDLAFNLLAARTENLNNKNVLIVEGNWYKSDLDSYDIFIDVDGTGRIIQELYYLAPHAIYDQYLSEIKKCFSTLVWHDEVK
jgi:hypothetical protein